MDKETEKLYTDYRNHLVDSRYKSYEQFDKAVFLLSGGGLTVSLTILKDLILFQTAQYKKILAVSWILFVIPLVFTLLSFIFSWKSLDQQIKLTDDYYLRDDKKALEKTNYYSVVTQYFNYISASSLVIGVSLFLIFIYLNIS